MGKKWARLSGWMAGRGRRRSATRSSAWARQVQVEIADVAGGLDVAMLTTSLPPVVAQAHSAAISRHLAEARSAIDRRRWYLPRNPVDWWRGTSVEQAYRSIHAARVFLAQMIPEPDAAALVPDAVARVTLSLGPTDPRRLEVEKLAVQEDEKLKRAELVHALDMGYSAADEYHGRIRAFRNVLLAAALLIASFMLVFVVAVASHAEDVPLCFHPDVKAAEATQQSAQLNASTGILPQRDVCPSGESRPAGPPHPASAADVWIIAGLGLLGGALASAVSIRKITGSSTPYDVPVALALLKVPTGALTAVAGILLLGGNFVPGLSDLDSQRQILAYALVFGYAQQLATRFIDDRATTLLSRLPSKYSTTPPAHSMNPDAAMPGTTTTSTTSTA
jgi:hypothetical protein